MKKVEHYICEVCGTEYSRGCSPFDCVDNGIFKPKGKKKRKVARPIV